MNVAVAPVAENECLSPSGSHDPYPERPFPLTLLLEVRKSSDVVHLHRSLRPADLARFGQHTLEQFRAFAPEGLNRSVSENCLLLSSERETAEARNERLFVL